MTSKTHLNLVILLVLSFLASAFLLPERVDGYQPYIKLPNNHNSDISTRDINILSGVSTVAAAALTTSTTLVVGIGTDVGFDWDINSAAAISLNVKCLQSNSPSGPWTLWADPDLGGLDTVNNVTVTTARGGTRLLLTGSTFAKLQFLNSGSQNVTVTRVTSFIR